jgi:hypothetical protein
LPVFGLLTPFPATPLYQRLEKAGRLTRPQHWLDFAPFRMAHEPLKMTVAQAEAEVEHAWANSYSPGAIERAIASIRDQPLPHQICHLLARFFFRGIYFPQMSAWHWCQLLAQNRRALFRLGKDVYDAWRRLRARERYVVAEGAESSVELAE